MISQLLSKFRTVYCCQFKSFRSRSIRRFCLCREEDVCKMLVVSLLGLFVLFVMRLTETSDGKWWCQHFSEHHRLTNHIIDWDSVQCLTFSTNYFQRRTLESCYTNLEQTPLNRCKQLSPSCNILHPNPWLLSFFHSKRLRDIDRTVSRACIVVQ